MFAVIQHFCSLAMPMAMAIPVAIGAGHLQALAYDCQRRVLLRLGGLGETVSTPIDNPYPLESLCPPGTLT